MARLAPATEHQVDELLTTAAESIQEVERLLRQADQVVHPLSRARHDVYGVRHRLRLQQFNPTVPAALLEADPLEEAARPVETRPRRGHRGPVEPIELYEELGPPKGWQP